MDDNRKANYRYRGVRMETLVGQGALTTRSPKGDGARGSLAWVILVLLVLAQGVEGQEKLVLVAR